MVFYNRKHHLKIPPYVSPLCLQSHTTIFTKIYLYTLVHKCLPINTGIWISLHFIHTPIISTELYFVTSLKKKHDFLKTWQRHVTLLRTQDGGMPTTRKFPVNVLHHPSTHITVQVLYTAIQNGSSLHEHPYLIYFLQSYLRILISGYPASNIVITSSPSSSVFIIYMIPFSLQSLTTYEHPITIL